MSTEWSVTRVQYWQACRFAYWLRYLAKVAPSQPVSRARVHGRLAHVGLAAAFEAARVEPGAPGKPMIVFRDAAHEAIMDHQERDRFPDRWRDDAWTEVASTLERLPAPAPSAVIAVERSFRLDLGGGLVLIGTIDYGARTGEDSAHIRDWKTGAIPETPEEIAHNIQLAVYAAIAASLLPWLRRLTVGLYSTRAGREVATVIGNDVIMWALGRIQTVAEQERSIGQLVQRGDESIKDAYPVTEGTHCASCDFRSYCPLFAKSDLPLRADERIETDRKRVRDLLIRP